ncbi:MAG: hypothetical protein RR478_05660 [Bacilli bacterium]
MKKYEETKDNSINKEEVTVNRKKLSTMINKKRRAYCLFGIYVGFFLGTFASFIAKASNYEYPDVQIVVTDKEDPYNSHIAEKNTNKYLDYLFQYYDFLSTEAYLYERMDKNSYDYADLALYIINDKETDIAIFAAYKGIKAGTNCDMDGLIRVLSYYDKNNEILPGDFSTFSEYIIAMGFVDEKGKADYQAYEKKFDDRALNLVESEKLTLEGRSLVKTI